MKKIVFITGGARSGKSKFAMERAKKSKSVLCVATYRRTGDKEMEERIKNHKMARPKNWRVMEEPVELSKIIKKAARNFKVVLIDCITLWVSNLILKRKTMEDISKKTQELINTLKKTDSIFIIVSNEVGLGVVPDTKMGRRFRDIAGKVNQIIAGNANEVYFMVAGIPMRVKKCQSIRVSE